MAPCNFASSPHKCVFCDFNNTSYATTCEACRAVTIPSKGDQRQPLDWEIYAFGPLRPPVIEATAIDHSGSTLSAVLGRFSRSAIYVGDARLQVLLVRVPDGDISFSVGPPPSMRDNAAGSTETVTWGSDTQQMFRIAVEHILGPGNTFFGKYDLLRWREKSSDAHLVEDEMWISYSTGRRLGRRERREGGGVRLGNAMRN
ncbi:hypothetical protein Z517_01845 [Fonsecaea pedrosoi CBS 271.37]|uniref:Uncharacterized protein n=1 Tax=Fonsecaea pedrosoi CBS 271.37 TaxID=1442368 RepID=A0A0D2GZI3_9EURO|nr:uncharacterized protein Z517_01845 [Fonsecaea pedrosoi CBS 271.37]KIW86448.1 hypothetical protein Z517_01845 [Fonsecaea pedrosoi CBS 271.37]